MVERALGKTLEDLVAQARIQPGAMEILKKWAEDTLAHHENPLYHKAAEWTARVRADAINKGAGKYPQPLRPGVYTFEQLLEHAMQENVDQAHYLTALKMEYEAILQRLQLAEAAEKALATIAAATDNQEPWKVAEVARNAAQGYFTIKEMVMRGK